MYKKCNIVYWSILGEKEKNRTYNEFFYGYNINLNTVANVYENVVWKITFIILQLTLSDALKLS